jgi:transcription initiation factor TFIIF subunit alpha
MLNLLQKRIKKEQLSANVFDTRDEREYEEEERERKRLEAMRIKQGKKVRKALMNREGNFTYEIDSDDNPYASSVGAILPSFHVFVWLQGLTIAERGRR